MNPHPGISPALTSGYCHAFPNRAGGAPAVVHCWSYTFSAKEKDVETGYSYFGSRYYSSDLSIWLSVDPMSDKYPSLSPYVYCANNPVMLVDPNGKWPEDRAKRFMKRNKWTHVYYEKDGSISVQYSKTGDNKSRDVVIRLKKFRMNCFERFISKIQRPSENINKRHSHRGGFWGTTNNPNAYPPGQDESTDAQVEQVNLDALQQLTVPKSNHFIESSFKDDYLQSDIEDNDKSEAGTSGTFIIFYDKSEKENMQFPPQAYGVPYSGSADSSKKRKQFEAEGKRVALIDIDK